MVSECKLFATKAKLESLKLQDYGTLPLLLEVLQKTPNLLHTSM